ncbi:MAG TPA: nucleoside phosphorylase [Cyclobacteriaceae bacterium]
MPKIPDSDLVLNKDGSIYHLNLKPGVITDKIIAVGDPGRVHRISSFFDNLEFEMNRREFVTHIGSYKGKKITVMSTGMGVSNIEIFFNEIDALVNIDFKKREEKTRKKKLKIIRIGTSASLQEDIRIGSHLVSDYAIGLDNLFQFYAFNQSSYEQRLSDTLKAHLKLNFSLYAAQCSKSLKEEFGEGMYEGITVTTPGFYASQGRKLRLNIKYPHLVDDLNYFHLDNNWITNFEMETAGYYGFAKMFGHEAVSLNAIIANRIKKRFSTNPNKIIDALIKKVLDRI